MRNVKFKIQNSGCWESNQAVNSAGYPTINIDGKGECLHRYIYESYHGDLDSGMVVRHTCDNKQCINPAHLVAGTPQDNVSDRDNRGRTAKGVQNGKAKLNETMVREIKLLLKLDVLSISALAQNYGVSRRTIRDIRGGRTWDHLS